MRVRLHKSLTTTFRKYPIGTILNLAKSSAERLISEGGAEQYSGPYPPDKKKKMRTNLFRPKGNS